MRVHLLSLLVTAAAVVTTALPGTASAQDRTFYRPNYYSSFNNSWYRPSNFGMSRPSGYTPRNFGNPGAAPPGAIDPAALNPITHTTLGASYLPPAVSYGGYGALVNGLPPVMVDQSAAAVTPPATENVTPPELVTPPVPAAGVFVPEGAIIAAPAPAAVVQGVYGTAYLTPTASSFAPTTALYGNASSGTTAVTRPAPAVRATSGSTYSAPQYPSSIAEPLRRVYGYSR
jgi:hypothetical protein